MSSSSAPKRAAMVQRHFASSSSSLQETDLPKAATAVESEVSLVSQKVFILALPPLLWFLVEVGRDKAENC
jgi:hypothetical protein